MRNAPKRLNRATLVISASKERIGFVSAGAGSGSIELVRNEDSLRN